MCDRVGDQGQYRVYGALDQFGVGGLWRCRGRLASERSTMQRVDSIDLTQLEMTQAGLQRPVGGSGVTWPDDSKMRPTAPPPPPVLPPS